MNIEFNKWQLTTNNQTPLVPRVASLFASVPGVRQKNMGHEYITYKEAYVQLNDFDIWLLRHFLLQSSSDAEFIAFANNIEWVGPGVFLGTDFYKFVAGNKEKVEVLVAALESAKKRLASFGSNISLHYLEKNVTLKGAYFKTEQSVVKHSENIDKIISCIRNVENA